MLKSILSVVAVASALNIEAEVEHPGLAEVGAPRLAEETLRLAEIAEREGLTEEHDQWRLAEIAEAEGINLAEIRDEVLTEKHYGLSRTGKCRPGSEQWYRKHAPFMFKIFAPVLKRPMHCNNGLWTANEWFLWKMKRRCSSDCECDGERWCSGFWGRCLNPGCTCPYKNCSKWSNGFT